MTFNSEQIIQGNSRRVRADVRLGFAEKGRTSDLSKLTGPVTHRLRAHPLYCVCVELEKGLDGDATTGYLQPQSGSQVVR
jgi:hypothetical protein